LFLEVKEKKTKQKKFRNYKEDKNTQMKRHTLKRGSGGEERKREKERERERKRKRKRDEMEEKRREREKERREIWEKGKKD
jgi:hypothetical protein